MDETNLNIIALSLLLIVIFYILTGTKKNAIIAFIIGAIFIPLTQNIVIFTINIFAYRLLIICAIIRFIIKNEFSNIKTNKIDKTLIIYVIINSLAYIMLRGDLASLIASLGRAFNVLGLYFTFRILLTENINTEAVLYSFIILCICISVFVLIEYFCKKNFFYIFGGVPEFTFIRDGKLRCQGPFGHPISSGTFGCYVFAVSYGLYYLKEKYKTIALVGFISSSLVIILSNSSGPYVTFVVLILGLMSWRLRHYLSYIKYSIVLLIILLHFLMKAPVWALIARGKILGGGGGYHRYILVDNFINRFNEWALFGVKSTAHWGIWMYDVSNFYVRQGVNGGILTLVFFLVFLYLNFKEIGFQLTKSDGDKKRIKFSWAMGNALLVHCVSFIGFSYWDQILTVFYLHTCIIYSISKNIFGNTRIKKKMNYLLIVRG